MHFVSELSLIVTQVYLDILLRIVKPGCLLSEPLYESPICFMDMVCFVCRRVSQGAGK